jgi:hypothetical protein
VNLIEAIHDPVLFGDAFTGPTWAPWRTFSMALFGLPHWTKGDAWLYRKCTGRTTIPTVPFREAALIIGRRGGKSRWLALIAVYLASLIDWRPYLAVGEVATVAILASDRKQAGVIMSYVRGLLRNVAIMESLVDVEQVETLKLNNSVCIEVYSARIASPRGRTFAAVLCDEIAFWRSDDSTNPDREVIAGIRPGLATLPHSMLLMASSPYSRRGVLWEQHRQHHSRDDSRVLVWQAASAVMNPSLDTALIEQAYEDDPISAAAEYGAQFRSDVAAFVSREAIDGCTQPGLYERLPVRGQQYFAFVDPSGGSADSFTCAIAHLDGNDRGILDCIRERKPPFSPEAVVAEYCDLFKSFGVMEVHGDAYGGEWPREQFRNAGIAYTTSDINKSAIYQELLPLLNSAKVELLDHTRLANQLASLERRTARGGRDRIDHPPGPNAHDDIANAVAGALVLAAGKPSPLAIYEKLATPTSNLVQALYYS